MRVHQRERSVVANRADVAEMVRKALEFRHQRAEPYCARWNTDVQSAFDRAGESDRIGNGAVAGRSRREADAAIERSARHQRFDALVYIAEPLLEADDRLAAGGEAKMPRLDDPGMDGADRNLMQPLALGSEKTIRRGLTRGRRPGAERMTNRPTSMVEPRTLIRGPDRLVTEQILDRALQARRRRMKRGDGGKPPPVTDEADDRNLSRFLVGQRH